MVRGRGLMQHLALQAVTWGAIGDMASVQWATGTAIGGACVVGGSKGKMYWAVVGKGRVVAMHPARVGPRSSFLAHEWVVMCRMQL